MRDIDGTETLDEHFPKIAPARTEGMAKSMARVFGGDEAVERIEELKEVQAERLERDIEWEKQNLRWHAMWTACAGLVTFALAMVGLVACVWAITVMVVNWP